jgi:hypothetical protein
LIDLAKRLTTKQKTDWCDKGKQQKIESMKGIAMEQFKVWAVGPEGKKVTARVKAESREAAIRKVEAKGYIVNQAELQTETPPPTPDMAPKQKAPAAFQDILNPIQSDNHQHNTKSATTGQPKTTSGHLLKFTVKGVERETATDTVLVVESETMANAKVKAELKGIVVTEILEPTGARVYPEKQEVKYQQPESVVPAEPQITSATIATGIVRGIFWVFAAIILFYLLLAYAGL